MAGLLRLASAARSLARGAAAPLQRRRLAAAAVAEDYWTEWEEEEEEEARRRQRQAPAAESCPAGGGPRGVQWVVMGRPGPQKHAHAARLAEVLAVPYISMGTLVRQELSPTSSLYKKIANSVNEGKLVPEDIIFGLLTKRLEEGYYKGETGFILDGIPRTHMQAEILDEIVDIDLVLNFKCADNCFMKKRYGGDICSHCGQLFDVSNPASMERNFWHAQAQPAAIMGLENARMEKMRSYAKQIRSRVQTDGRPGSPPRNKISSTENKKRAHETLVSLVSPEPSPRNAKQTKPGTRARAKPPLSPPAAAAAMAMESVETLVAHVQALSGSGEDLAQLHSLLRKAEGDVLRGAHTDGLFPFLSQLSPAAHSLGYLYLLDAFVSSPANVRGLAAGWDLLVTIADFLTSCSASQIRLAPDKFLNVCRVLKNEVMLLNVPIRGIAPLRAAVRKVQASSEQLTPLHPEYLLLCLLAKQYKAGLSVLEDDIFQVDQPRDLFLYCYYGGMIYIGLKKFHKALELLHNAVTAPMSSLNAITVEAYKKYVLVSLIQNGQVPSFPKYTSVTVQRNLKNHTQIYVDLSTCYGNGNYSELETFIQSNADKFQSDNNFGLVKQVLSSMYKRNIQRLTQTYLTLSLEDIASSVQLNTPKEAEMHVLRMIEDGEIHATINQKDGMVSFNEDPEQYKSSEMVEHIDSSIQRLMALSKKLTSIDENISCNHAYLAKTGKERGRFDYDDFDSVPHKYF